MQDALPFHPRIEVENVDVARPALVSRVGHGAGQLLLAGVGGDGDDLARLYVRSETDREVGELPGLVGEVAHRRGRVPVGAARMAS